MYVVRVREEHPGSGGGRMRLVRILSSADCSAQFERWRAAQERVYLRWYWATQAATASWVVVGLASAVFDLPGWLWLTAIPPWAACRWAWHASYKRLATGMDEYAAWLKEDLAQVAIAMGATVRQKDNGAAMN